jgi:hypothetical protein
MVRYGGYAALAPSAVIPMTRRRDRLDRVRRLLFDADQPLTATQVGWQLGLPVAGRAVHLLRTLERRGQAQRVGVRGTAPLWAWRDDRKREGKEASVWTGSGCIPACDKTRR